LSTLLDFAKILRFYLKKTTQVYMSSFSMSMPVLFGPLLDKDANETLEKNE